MTGFRLEQRVYYRGVCIEGKPLSQGLLLSVLGLAVVPVTPSALVLKPHCLG